jgi:hypothetical protein
MRWGLKCAIKRQLKASASSAHDCQRVRSGEKRPILPRDWSDPAQASSEAESARRLVAEWETTLIPRHVSVLFDLRQTLAKN